MSVYSNANETDEYEDTPTAANLIYDWVYCYPKQEPGRPVTYFDQIESRVLLAYLV
jgi:hypothetical protein